MKMSEERQKQYHLEGRINVLKKGYLEMLYLFKDQKYT
jgi:hypothetical protein